MKRSFIILLVFVVCSATIRVAGPEPAAPVYPVYFGNRIDIPADNPLTVQGVKGGEPLEWTGG